MRARLAFAALALLAGAAPAWCADPAHEAGRKVFNETAQPPCKLCHVLRSAGAAGKLGPSLDELKPDLERALQVLRNGSGVMPLYRDKLTAAEIDAVANFVSRTAGSAD